MKGKLITLLTALSFVGSSFAQEAAPAAEPAKPCHWMVGIKGGANYLRWSDQNVQFPAVGAFVGYTISPLIGLNLEYLYMNNDRDQVQLPTRPEFTNTLHDITLQAKLNFSNLFHKTRSEGWQKFNIYGIAGAGVTLSSFEPKGGKSESADPQPVALAGLSAEYNINKFVVGLGADYRFHTNNDYIGGMGGRSIATATLSVGYRFGATNVGSKTVAEFEGEAPVQKQVVQPFDDSALRAQNSELASRVTKNEGDIRKLQGDVKSLQDSLVALKEAKAKVPVKYTPTEQERRVLETAFTSLEFETGSAVIKRTSFASLNGLADLLMQRPDWTVTLNGFTDSTGSVERNLQLSKERAESVKTYLVGRGVPASAITTNGFGIANPIASNATAAGRAKNRRVEIELFSTK